MSMRLGDFSPAANGVPSMRKFNRARSSFFSPIINLEEGVFFVRPYAYAKAFSLESREVREMCRNGSLPHFYDGETYLIIIDMRDHGEGGQFAKPRSPFSDPLFPRWRGKRAC